MTGRPGPRIEVKIDVTKRREAAVRMLSRGHTYEQIATALGYASRGHAHTDVREAYKEARDSMATTVNEHREMQLDRLAELESVAWELVRTRHLRIHNGDVVTVSVVDMESGRHEEVTVEDTGPVLAALAELRKLQAERAKLTGTAAPVRVEAEGRLVVSIQGPDGTPLEPGAFS